MKNVATLLGAVLLFAASGHGQQAAQEKKAFPKPTSAPKPAPTLAFSHIKDVSPVFDIDAYDEEKQLQKKLPGNQFVYDKRAMHEAAMMNDFIDAFKDSKECNGITFYLKSDKKPDFTVQVNVMGHDDPKLGGESWTWILGYPGDPSPVDSKAHGMGGMGSQSNAKLTARDVCLTVWDDVDPNHFKKSGGKIE